MGQQRDMEVVDCTSFRYGMMRARCNVLVIALFGKEGLEPRGEMSAGCDAWKSRACACVCICDFVSECV